VCPKGDGFTNKKSNLSGENNLVLPHSLLLKTKMEAGTKIFLKWKHSQINQD
jgi:hypothetical protein